MALIHLFLYIHLVSAAIVRREQLKPPARQVASSDPIPIVPTATCPRANPQVTSGTLIDQLWTANCDLVSKFLNNRFCAAQAAQTAEGTLESFQYYSVQDYYYLISTIPQKAYLLNLLNTDDSDSKLTLIINDTIESMSSDLEYASEFRQALTSSDHLNIPESVVQNTYLQAAPLGYVKWLEKNTAFGSYFFDIARIACIYGWAELAYQLNQSTVTDRTSKFYSEWIVPNLDWSYGAHISDRLQLGLSLNNNSVTFATANRLFREGLSFEIGFFESSIGKTLNDAMGHVA